MCARVCLVCLLCLDDGICFNSFFFHPPFFCGWFSPRIYNDKVDVTPGCYNLFNAWTAGGAEWWTFKVYGSGKVEVILNGKELDMDEAESCGNVTSAYSPKMQGTRHSIFELSFKASPGRFGTQCRFFLFLSFFCTHTRAHARYIHSCIYHLDNSAVRCTN